MGVGGRDIFFLFSEQLKDSSTMAMCKSQGQATPSSEELNNIIS